MKASVFSHTMMKASVFSLLLSGALGSYVTVTDCNEYKDCEGGYQYMVDGYMKPVLCAPRTDPSKENFYSKTYGELEEGSLLGFCKSKGYDTLDDYVFQAVPRTHDPNSVTDPKAIICNKRFGAQSYNWVTGDGINHDAVTPGSDNSKEHQTWKCRNYPYPDKKVECCNYIFKFGEKCSSLRTDSNNYSRCGVFDSCKDDCSDLDSRQCFNCCYPLKGGDEWNCFTPLASKSPTPSPVNPTDAPSGTPTASPVDPTDAPSGTPTSSPVSGPPTSSPVSGPPTSSPVDLTDAPSRTPTASPVDNSSPGPTVFDKDIAELICTSAKSKKVCKHALTKNQGTCKWKSGKKGGKCHLKHYKAPLDCETLKKRQCKKAKKSGQCVAGDSKGTCKEKGM